MKEVAVAILNWNGKHWLEKFLTNVIENSPEADIIVIDNGSSDDSISYLEASFKDVKLIQLDNNYGFCGGYNKGLQNLSYHYILLLNSDIEVTSNWLQPLLKTIKSSDNVAIVQPKILDYNDKSKFEYAGAAGGYLDKYGYPFCRGRIFNSLEKDENQHQTEEEVVWATGAAMLVKTEIWKKLNGLDELFFAHMEEIDFCWRAQNHGFKVKVNPESMVYHVGGGTLPKNSPRKTFLNFRNGLSLLYKNLPSNKFYSTLAVRLVLDGVAAIFFLIKGYPKDFWAIFRAHLSFYSNINKLNRQSNASIPKKMYRKSIVWQHFIKGKKVY